MSERECSQKNVHIDCQHTVSTDSEIELRHLVGAAALFQGGHSELRFTVSAGIDGGCFLYAGTHMIRTRRHLS